MKIKELQKELQKRKIDSAIFFDKDQNLRYFAEVKIDSGMLFIPKKGKAQLYILGFEADRIKKLTKVQVVKKPIKLKGTVGTVFEKISLKKAKDLEKRVKLKDMEDICIKLRQIKNKKEIETIKKACKETDKIMQLLLRDLKRFKTEQDIANYLQKIINYYGYLCSFPPIIATGKNAGVPHFVPGKTKLKGFTIIDFGIKYKGYCSDITRTVYYGKPSKKEQAIYDKILKVQKELINKVKDGKKFEELNSYAQKKIGKSLIHSIGHCLGVQVHDVCERPLKLKKGMVITIEPGTYTKKYGIRIEDDILVKGKRAEVLTKVSKKLKTTKI